MARCQECNGILQSPAVPTGARVHPNPVTYPESTHFPITAAGKATTLKLLTDIEAYYTACLAGCGRWYISGAESGAVHGWAKAMEPEVCFVVGFISFSSTAGVGKKAGAQRTEIPLFQVLFTLVL